MDDNSFFSAGKAISTKKDIIRFARYPNYSTLLTEIDLPYRAYVSAVDWNQNGYPDLVVGSYDGMVYLLLNEKQIDKPVFKKPAALKNVVVESAAAPTAVDWDNDGHWDIIVGNGQGELYLFLNNGDNVFRSKIRLTAGKKTIKLDGAAAPVAADWDNDGVLDLLVGDAKGRIHFFKGKEPGTADLIPGTILEDEHGEILVEGFAAPAVTDWNEDGLLDLVVGDAAGELTLYQRDYSGKLSKQGKIAGQNKNFFASNNINVGHFAVPVIVDLNNDNKKDLLTGHLEYGSPYAIDEQFFPYKKELKKNIAYCQANNIPIIPHMYLNEYSTSKNEIWEMKLHQAAFNKLEIPWDMDMGVNHHTWRINKNAKQTFMNQKTVGIWWNFGFNPPNIATAPRDGKEFLLVLPFMLATDGSGSNKASYEEFLLFSPAPNCLNFGLAWDALARYDIPLTYFEHIEHCMKPGTKENKKLIQKIGFINDFRDRCGYTFQTEEQMARSLLNTFYGEVLLEETSQGLLATPNYINVPANVKEYKRTLGIKVELGEQYADKQIDTSSVFFYEGDGCYYIGLDNPASINFVDKTTMKSKLHFVQSNGPLEITSVERNEIRLNLNAAGMQELKVYSPVKLKIKGKRLKITRVDNYYTIIHYGDPVKISIKI